MGISFITVKFSHRKNITDQVHMIGAEQVFVHVHRNNKPAQLLYQKMGFEVVPFLFAFCLRLLCHDY